MPGEALGCKSAPWTFETTEMEGTCLCVPWDVVQVERKLLCPFITCVRLLTVSSYDSGRPLVRPRKGERDWGPLAVVRCAGLQVTCERNFKWGAVPSEHSVLHALALLSAPPCGATTYEASCGPPLHWSQQIYMGTPACPCASLSSVYVPLCFIGVKRLQRHV